MEPIGIRLQEISVSNVLNRQTIESLVSKVRRSGGKQVELVDDREAGLRVRAGQRSATWQLSVRLQNGKRSRIKLGSWPAMGIADARRAAQLKKAEVLEGVDPNEEKREVAREALRKAQQRRIVRDVLDQYDHERLSGLRTGAATRRALDGDRGLLKPFALRDITSITAGDILEEVRNHRHRAPIAANRNLAYAKAFFNWCMGEQILDTNPAATIKKPAKERVRDRFHTIEELEEIWVAAGSLGYPFGPLVQLLIALPMRRTEVTSIELAELDLAAEGRP
ncbi:MAG: integrase arm-type DNA-binding domain-containing protein, partial [Parasphingopyxis sp.]